MRPLGWRARSAPASSLTRDAGCRLHARSEPRPPTPVTSRWSTPTSSSTTARSPRCSTSSSPAATPRCRPACTASAGRATGAGRSPGTTAPGAAATGSASWRRSSSARRCSTTASTPASSPARTSTCAGGCAARAPRSACRSARSSSTASTTRSPSRSSRGWPTGVGWRGRATVTGCRGSCCDASRVAHLGLGSAVISRLPARRRRPGPLLDAAFSLTVIAGIAAAALLLLVAAGFSDELRVVASDPLYAGVFAGASLFGTLGILLDQTNTALRRGDQALVRGVVFGVGALAGLIAIAVVAGRGDARAIFAPWLLAGLAGAVIGVVQLRRSSGYAPRPRLERAPARELLRVGLPNQVLTLAERTPGLLLPILITELVSPSANAAWYVAW